MSEKIKLVQNDTRPNLVVTLTDKVTGAPVGLASTTVKMHVRELGSSELKTTITATIFDAANGVCIFAPADAPEFLDTAGEFEGEVEITFQDGTIQTMYETLRFKVREDF